MAAEPTAIQPAPSSLFDIERTKRNIEQWEEVKRSVLTKNDTIQIGSNTYIKRSGWRKLALAANVATSVVDIKTEPEGEWTPENAKGDFTATVKAKAALSWGRWAEDVGVYAASEFVSKDGRRLPISKHNIIARAATRAINRSISDLIGGGLVSAEEVLPDAETKGNGGLGGGSVTREEVEYAVKDFGDSVIIEEALDGFKVRLMKSLSKPEFDSLKSSLASLGGTYEPAKGADGPCFLVKK